jgi:hypothetical protein
MTPTARTTRATETIETFPGYVNGYNVYDNQAQINGAFRGDTLIGELFIPYIGNAFLQFDLSTSYMLAYLAVRGWVRHKNYSDKEKAIYTLSIANLIGLNLQDACIQEAAACRTRFRTASIVFFCKEGRSNRFFTYTEEAYQAYKDRVQGFDISIAEWESDTAVSTLCARQSLTATMMRDFLFFWVTAYGTKRMENIPTYLYILAFVSLGKRGIITENKCQSLKTSFGDEGIPDVPLEPATVSYIYTRLNVTIDENNLNFGHKFRFKRMNFCREFTQLG